MKREQQKVLLHRHRYGREIPIDNISECAKVLKEIQEIAARLQVPIITATQINRWDYYYNQRGGSCNGN